ncbi:MAG TPA: PilZ domain-containing protein [bacterium]|nr:PilZ domain-containing protein [bacterium]HOL48182.1 PilZ domain-containing protein [bacterium]HPQ19487.1 PilZ domain-containing protein [bacterium]
MSEKDINEILNKISEIQDKQQIIKILPLLTSSQVPIDIKEKIVLNCVRLKVKEILPYLIKLYSQYLDNQIFLEKIIWALGIFGDENVVPLITKILQSQEYNTDIKTTAAMSLCALGFEDKVKNIMNYLKVQSIETERRKTPRIILKLPVIILANNIKIYGFTNDLSKGGLKFISIKQITTKESINIFFPTLGQNILFSGVLISSYTLNNLFHHHIKFFKTKKENRTILFNYTLSLMKNQVIKPELYLFPGSGECRFLEKKLSNKSHINECWELMDKNYYYDTGLSWIKLKCYKCPVYLFRNENKNVKN